MENMQSTELNYNNPLGDNILEMSLQMENYNTIIDIVCETNDCIIRRAMISQLAYKNPHLSAKIVMTMNDELGNEKAFLLEIIERRLKRVFNRFNRMLLLLALLELEENEKFELTDKCNIDLSNVKTINYFMNRLNVKQQLVFIKILLKNSNKGVGAAVQLIKNTHDECNADIIDTAKLIFQTGRYGASYKLLQITELNHDISSLFGISQDSLIETLLTKTPSLSMDETEFLFNIKYDLRKETVNDINIWKNVFSYEPIEVVENSIDRLIRRYLKENILSNDTCIQILKCKCISEEYYKEGVIDKTFMEKLLKPAKKKLFYKEPFYSAMANEEEIINLLKNEKFINKYAFSEDKRLKVNTDVDEDSVKEEYDYFDKCAQNFSSSKTLIYVYFNTPLKYTINFEHLLETLINCYQYDEQDLKYLFRKYVFKGRVCNINKNSVSIRAYNVLTKAPCRMSKEHYYVMDDGQKRNLKLGDLFYFKFNYFALSVKKINVYLPALSLENMREIEASTLGIRD